MGDVCEDGAEDHTPCLGAMYHLTLELMFYYNWMAHGGT